MTSIRKNFTYNFAYQILRIITPIITVPYLSRVLGPENIGIYSYTHSITNYFILFSVLGMSTYGVRAIATVRDDRILRSRVFWSAYTSQLSISVIVIICYAVYSLTIQQGGLLLCFLWSFWVVSAAIDVTWLMFGIEDFKATTLRNVAVKLLELVLIFLLVKTSNDLWIYIAIVSGGFLLSQLVLWPFVPKHVDFVKPTWAEVRIHYIPNLRLFIPVAAISLYTMMDKVLLGMLSNMTQTGYFEYSEKISKIPLALITALGTVMLPRMSAVFSAGDETGGKSLLEISMWFMQAVAFAMAFGVAAIAPELALVFLGEEFIDCAPAMAILAIVIPFISGSNVIGRQYLIPMFRDGHYTISVACGAIVDIIAIVYLAPELGALGAAIATVSAEGTVLMVQAWFVRHELPLMRYLVNALPFAISGALMAIAVRFSADMFNAIWGISVLGLVLEIAVGAIVYCIFAGGWCLATNNPNFKRLFNMGFLKTRR